jgi:hypothetical protein
MLPVVRRILELDLASSRGFQHGLSKAELARALARVVAHEVFHVVAPAVPHASSGLMSGRLGRAELLRRESRIDSGSRRALWAALDAYQATAGAQGATAGKRARLSSSPGL